MDTLEIEKLENMSPVEEQVFWATFEKALANDDGAAAKAHLAAGRPIHYCDDLYPNDYIREWPDGRRELVAVDEKGAVSVIRPL